MYISQRSLNIPTSPIRKLAPIANRAEKAGRKIYHLNIGQPDIRRKASMKGLPPAIPRYWLMPRARGTRT